MRLIRLLLMRYRLRHERWRLAGDTGKNAAPPSQTGGFFVVSGTIVRLSYCVLGARCQHGSRRTRDLPQRER